MPTTGDFLRVHFTDKTVDPSISFYLKFSDTLLALWDLDTIEDQLRFVTELAEAIEEHDPTKAFKEEYSFNSDNSESSPSRMLNWIKRNGI